MLKIKKYRETSGGYRPYEVITPKMNTVEFMLIILFYITILQTVGDIGYISVFFGLYIKGRLCCGGNAI